MGVKKVKLKSILKETGISSGYSFRKKIDDDKNGNIKVIQLKDLINDYTVIDNTCFKVSSKKINSKYILIDGDVLFISKGYNNKAITFSSDKYPGNYMASSALFVISMDKTVANPRYISWYINQSRIQNFIKQNTSGTYTPTVNRKVVENIPLKLPDLEKQNRIAQLAQLTVKEKFLQQKIQNKREMLVNAQLLKFINQK